MRPALRFRLEKALINPTLRAILRSPLHRRLSESLIVLDYDGHRSGRQRSLVVAYASGGIDRLVVAAGQASAKQWWRNFRSERPVEITLRGCRQPARARLLVSEEEVARARAAYAKRFPRLAQTVTPEADIRLLSIELSHG